MSTLDSGIDLWTNFPVLQIIDLSGSRKEAPLFVRNNDKSLLEWSEEYLRKSLMNLALANLKPMKTPISF